MLKKLKSKAIKASLKGKQAIRKSKAIERETMAWSKKSEQKEPIIKHPKLNK